MTQRLPPTHIPAEIDLHWVEDMPWLRRLHRTYAVRWRGHTFEVRAPFTFDGSSIWRLVWAWLGGPFDWGNAQGGALHDAAYDGMLWRDGEKYWMPPAAADALWREVRTALWVRVARTRVEAARYRIQGWICWALIRLYYHCRGHRNYCTRETWEKWNT